MESPSSVVRVESDLLDTANTSTLINGNACISLFTPASTPGVLDDPVVKAVNRIAAPADNRDGMISI